MKRPEGGGDTDNNFTVLRLVLALMVVLGHFQAFGGVHSPPWPFTYAAAAVDCFFVVSGYLVTSSFDRDPDLMRFYVRRIFRIYPLYIAVVFAQTLILGQIAPGGLAANTHTLVRYFAANAVFANFAMHDIGGVMEHLADPSLNASLWTLKIEFGFYLILPFLWRGVRRFGPALLIGIFIASAVYYEALLRADNYQYAKQLPGQLQFFVLGIAAYQYHHRIRIGRRAGAALGVVFLALMTAMLRWQPAILYPAVVATLVVIVALKAPRLPMKRDISYGVYLLHAPVIQLSLIFGVYRAGWIGVFGILAVVLPLAILADRSIETPGIALGRNMSRRVGRRRSPAPAPAPPDDRLTVVVLNDFCHVQGGASKVAIDEAVDLARSGVNVVFLGAVGPVGDELRAAPVAVHCLDQVELADSGHRTAAAIQGLWNGKAGREARAILSRLPPDRTVVHLHGYTKAITTAPVRAANRLGFPVVCTLHDFFAACPNGAFYDYRAGRPCPRRALSLGCALAHCDKRHYAHKLYRVARGWIQHWRGRFPASVRHYISLSERSASLLTPYLPRGAQLYPLSNIGDTSRKPRVDVAGNAALLYVGRLDPEKGVRLLADTASRLGLAITFVGDGALRNEIAATPNMTVTGWLSRDAVQAHLERARCLIFPSLWYETYGLTVAEAASRGIPAIVSDITAAAERIDDGVTGWRFRSGDGDDLARYLRLVADDDDLVSNAGAACYRTFWSAVDDQPRHADGLIQIYRSVLRQAA